MLDGCYSGDVCVLLGFFVGFLAPAADGMALPVVLRWYTGNQMRFGSRRPCERFPICAVCMVQAFRMDKLPGSSPGHGFPKGGFIRE